MKFSNKTFSSLKLNHLFSIPLMEFDYGQTSEDENKIIYHYLNNLKPNVYNASTIESYILDKGLTKLKNFIENSIDTYVRNIIVGDDYDENLSFKITQSWANLTKPGGLGHHQHTHSNSLISGVFYVSTNDIDSIVFTNDYLYFQTIKVDVKKFNEFNANIWRYPVKAGKLLLFPSNLPHRVDPPTGNKDRISLSFNVFPFGLLGCREQLSELRILEDK